MKISRIAVFVGFAVLGFISWTCALAAEPSSTQELTKQLVRCGVVGDVLAQSDRKYKGSSDMFYGAAGTLTSPQEVAKLMMDRQLQPATNLQSADLLKEFDGCQLLLFANIDRIGGAAH